MADECISVHEVIVNILSMSTKVMAGTKRSGRLQENTIVRLLKVISILVFLQTMVSTWSRTLALIMPRRTPTAWPYSAQMIMGPLPLREFSLSTCWKTRHPLSITSKVGVFILGFLSRYRRCRVLICPLVDLQHSHRNRLCGLERPTDICMFTNTIFWWRQG